MPGLFCLVFIGFALWSSVVKAVQPDPFFSPSWIHAQSLKTSNNLIQLAHIVNGGALHGAPLSQPNSIGGGIMMDGPAHRLYDLSQSWKLIGCNNHRDTQKVLAYCKSTNPNANCGDIFIGGAQHTIVRLPHGCGASPFAHVVKFERTSRHLGSKSVAVFEFTFDYDFQAIPHKSGENPTKIHMEFSNLPSYANLSDFGEERSYTQWLQEIHLLSAHHEHTLHINKRFSVDLANLSQKCTDFTMHLKIAADGHFDGQATFGYYFSGTIIPPFLTDHYVYLSADAKADANINLSGLAKYAFKGVNIPIVAPRGLPGMSYPGFLEIDPYFEVLAGLKGDVAIDGSVMVKAGFTLPTVSVSLGKGSSRHTNHTATTFGSVTFSNRLQVSTGLTAYLAPQIGIKIKSLNNVIGADVALRPSAGITAAGNVSIGGTRNITRKGTKGGLSEVKKPCVEIDGALDLFWILEGKLGTWSKEIQGRIWGISKKLSKCLNIPKVHHGKWKRAHSLASPQPRAAALDSMVCPLLPPFSN